MAAKERKEHKRKKLFFAIFAFSCGHWSATDFLQARQPGG
jgi:hypothetical protein